MDKSKKLFIFGSTDFAVLVKDYFEEYSEYTVVGFVLDQQYIKEDELHGLPVVPFEKVSEIYPNTEYECFVAAGYKNMNRLRDKKMQSFKEMGYKLATYIDPLCRKFDSVKVGENCFIMENVVLHPRVKVGNGTCILSSVCIGHDTVVQDNCFITLGAMVSGHVVIGNNCFIGSNATINDGIKVAEFTLVGAGAYINKNTTKYGAYPSMHSKNMLKKMENAEALQATML